LRIAMIGPFGLRRKGTSRARLLPMAQSLAERGHQVDVVLPPWDSPEDSAWQTMMGLVPVRHTRLPPATPGLFGLLLCCRLVREALASRPEVVHCFKPKAYAGAAAFALWYAARLGLTRARVVLDTDDWEGRGGWNEMGSYSRAQRALFSYQEQCGLGHCHALTVASRALETLAWSRGVPREKVSYVPNGWQDTAANVSGMSAGHSGTTSVLLVTRFIEFDIRWLVDVWEEVIRRMPGAVLSVVGKGLSGEERLLQEMVEARRLARSVEYLGWLEGDDLLDCEQETQLAIFPYDDTLVNRTKCSARLVQLMASGLPTIATDVGQNREYIEHGLSGWLVPADDSGAFAAAVVGLLRDEELRSRLGQGAKERILSEFSWDKLVERVEKAYLGALGQVNETSSNELEAATWLDSNRTKTVQ
jgi:glycosyltransferase involved in cell wall biosynthesis